MRSVICDHQYFRLCELDMLLQPCHESPQVFGIVVIAGIVQKRSLSILEVLLVLLQGAHVIDRPLCLRPLFLLRSSIFSLVLLAFLFDESQDVRIVQDARASVEDLDMSEMLLGASAFARHYSVPSC